MTDATPRHEYAPLLEQAARWFTRMREGGLSQAEREAFARWRADPINSEALADVERAHEAARTVADSNEILALRHETLSRIVIANRGKRRRHALAAGLAIAMVSGAALFAVGGRIDAPPQELASAPSMKAYYETGVGERLTVRLDDGSVVILNTNTKVRPVYTASQRRLVLERGQALFEVAKNKTRPFVVAAGDQLITAVGTIFDVRIDKQDEVKVALLEGAVTVKRISSSAPQATILRTNEVLTATPEDVRIVNNPKLEQEMTWRDGLVVFENKSLGEAVAEMNRYSRQSIVLGDESLRQIRVSGAFRTGETSAFVEALQLSFPLRVTQRLDDRIILGHRS